VIDVTGAVIRSPITFRAWPVGVAVTPGAESLVYVTSEAANTVSLIDTPIVAVAGNPITVGANPNGVA
jgi:YVTN family beta-propeller protein